MQYQLIDNHHRPINYLRLSVTDRCNLRCFYCMPADGINYLPKSALLTYEEMERIVSMLADMGINKIRITGGEPFIRKDLIKFLFKIKEINKIRTINITTNGILLKNHIEELKTLQIRNINLSLDTLDERQFKKITRRDDFNNVMGTLHELLNNHFKVKINVVVMKGINDTDILPMIELTRNNPISVRFIEEMPFNGKLNQSGREIINHKQILQQITSRHGSDIIKLPDPYASTSTGYKVNGYTGDFGIIAAFSRTFCGSCNRIRITAKGVLKTCLYDKGALNVKDLMRDGHSDEQIRQHLLNAIKHRAKDGIAAEKANTVLKTFGESMSAIGG